MSLILIRSIVGLDTQKLSTYFHHCFQTGFNICALENSADLTWALPTVESRNTPSTLTDINAPSTSTSSANATPATTGKRKFTFLCGFFENERYIYGLKFDNHVWHYFEVLDTKRAQHVSLPDSVDASIVRLKAVGPIHVHLDEAQSKNYFKNGKFIFKNKELNTRNVFSNT